jgi:predicted membrane protein (TIGR00267 family)
VALAGQNASDRTSIDPEPAVNDHSPRRDALVMASAYAVGATIPLLPFIGGFLDDGPALVLAMALAGLTLFFLGVGKGSLSNQHRIRSGLQMLVLASAAGLAGYFLGVLARAVFGLDA